MSTKDQDHRSLGSVLDQDQDHQSLGSVLDHNRDHPSPGSVRDPPWPSGYDAWLPSVSSQVRVSAGSPSGLAWSLYRCAALCRTAYAPSATERPL